MRSALLAAVVSLSLVSSGCGASRPTRGGENIAPEAEAAIRVTQLSAALQALTDPPGASPIERLVSGNTITKEEGIQVATIISEAQGYARDAAIGLKASLEAREEAAKQTGLARVAVLLQQIADKLAASPLGVGTEAGRKAVFDLMRTASAILLTVDSFLPKPAPGPVAFAF